MVREWAGAGAVVLLALVLRLIYVFQVRDTSLVLPEELDPALYYNWARDIAGGDWLGKEAFVQSPLYAYVLGLLMTIIGTGIGPILVTQSIVGCVTVLLTWLLGRRLFGHGRGLLAAAIVAVYGPFIFYEGMVMKTFLSPLLTIAMALLFDRAREAALAGGDAADAPPDGGRRATRLFGLTGMVYGLSVLDRDNFILLAPALAVLVLWLGGGWSKRGLRAAAAFTVGTVLIIAPVTMRNWAVSGDFVLLTTGGGEVFFIGNNEDANGLYVPPPFVRPDPKYEHADFVSRASEIAGERLTPIQSSWFWFREGMRFIAEEPTAWLRLLGLKMVHFWNFFELPDNLDYQIMRRFSPLLEALNASFPPDGAWTLSVPIGQGRSAPVRLHLWSAFGTLAPLGLLGLALTWRGWRRLLPLYLLLFGYMGTVLLFFNFSRFRVPIVPILALFAAEPLFRFGRWLASLGRAAFALILRSGDLHDRLRALRPGRAAATALTALAVLLACVNVERPRGVVPAIEQALILGNAYYAQNEWDTALRHYMAGLVYLGELPPGPAGDAILRRFGPGVTREALAQELEVEAIARGPQFKGMHLGIHHGIGIALTQKAAALLDRGERREALPLLDRAIAQYQEVLRLAPSYLLSHRKMARAYALKGDSDGAIEWLTKAADLWPEDIATRFELAEQLYHKREFRLALRHLDEARAYGRSATARERAQIYFHRGLVLFHGLGEAARALFNFEKALETDPSLPQAEEIRNAILELRAQGHQPVPDDTPPGPSQPPSPGS